MSDDDDLAFAMFLQEQFDNEDGGLDRREKTKLPTSLVDDAWEMIDPVPDIRQLFLQFNDEYFDGLLGGVEVRWSPRMTLCAGLCCYEGRGGLCSIRLSEPLLKLRPRKDLIQTLLHEMIHALLFVTQNNKDHDGHGPEFHKHMYRINKQSGTNITVYHNFHDEVNSYRLHWWKCNGPCQKWSPFYGVVKRSMNRAPAPRDTWWDDHKRKCGGQFTKIKEPENYGKKKNNNKTKKSEAGPSKEKDKILGSGTPSLPTFFDKMKKQKATGSNVARQEETDSKESSKLDDDNFEEYAENPAKKQKTEGILPFSGTGHVLGGSKSEKRSKLERKQDSVSLSGKNSPEHSHCEKEKSSYSSSQETSSTKGKISIKTKNRKKPLDMTDKQELTIIDAFKRSDKSLCSSTKEVPVGSKGKPISLCEEDSTSIVASSSSSSCDVACPVCLLAMPITNINSHLDSCLKPM